MSIRTIREAEDRYISDRLQRSNGSDDRSDRGKLNADARLRGNIGSHAADKIIKHIDEMKSWR